MMAKGHNDVYVIMRLLLGEEISAKYYFEITHTDGVTCYNYQGTPSKPEELSLIYPDYIHQWAKGAINDF